MIDSKITKNYNMKKNQKKKDQHFLIAYVYPLLRNVSVIHDSHLCKLYKDSKPFPTRRIGACFIGSTDYDNSCINKKFHLCPEECRPKNHKDWTTC